MILLKEVDVSRTTKKVTYLVPSQNGQACWEMRELIYDIAVNLDDIDPHTGRFIGAGSLHSLLHQLIHQMSLEADKDDTHDLRGFFDRMNEFMQQARRTINVKRYFVHDSAPTNPFPVDENDMETFANQIEFQNCREVAGPEIPLVQRSTSH